MHAWHDRHREASNPDRGAIGDIRERMPPFLDPTL
jgi:hypothetical protein